MYRQIVGNMKNDVYIVMQVHKNRRSFCDAFASLEKANNRFEELTKYFEDINKVAHRDWTTSSIPSQVRVYIIGDITLYLCKEEI